MLVIPKTKQMASRMLDLPLPFSPVMELKLSSLCDVSPCHATHHATRDRALDLAYQELMTVRTAYDLKPYRNCQRNKPLCINFTGITKEERTSIMTSVTLILAVLY